MWQAVLLLLLTASAYVRSQEAESSNFLVPALLSYEQCDAVPYPQTLTIYLTTQQLVYNTSRVFLAASGRSTFRFLWALNNNNAIDNVFEYDLLELHDEAKYSLNCLNYYCNEKPSDEVLQISNGTCSDRDSTSGVYAYIDFDPTVSFIVSNKGPNFMILYAALPISGQQDVTYHILNPTRYLENYIQAFALRGLNANNTEVTIIPTTHVKVFRPALTSGIVVTMAEAYDTIYLTVLPFETVWVEVEVTSCDSTDTLTGTIIKSSNEMAVFSAQALCNETFVPYSNSTDNDTAYDYVYDDDEDNAVSGSLAFSFILNPLYQIPPTHRWGDLYIVDLKKLALFGAEMEFYVVSFSILSSTESQVSITCHGPEQTPACKANQLLDEGEIWNYELRIKSTLPAEAVVIRASGPIMVLHEIYSQGRDDAHHMELLQSTEWFLNVSQAVPVAYSLKDTQPQAFAVNLIISNDYPATSKKILVWDSVEIRTPRLIENYSLVQNYSYSTVDGYTLVHILLDPIGYNKTDFVLRFAVYSALSTYDQATRFGASIFSYGGYAYSNGYILENNSPSPGLVVIEHRNLHTVLGSIVGVFAVLLALAVGASVLMICYRRGLNILPWLPPPPSEGFDYDVFLSFADEDKDFTQKILYKPLLERGYKVLLHSTDFVAGMTIEDNIIHAVNTSRVVVYVCSKNFNESSFCQTELKYGMESHYNKYEGRYRRVIPIWIGGECPSQLRTFRIRPIKTSASLEQYDEEVIGKLIKELKLSKPINRSPRERMGSESKQTDGSKQTESDGEVAVELV